MLSAFMRTTSLISSQTLDLLRFTFIYILNYIFQYYKWNLELDQGRMPEGLEELLQEMGVVKQEG